MLVVRTQTFLFFYFLINLKSIKYKENLANPPNDYRITPLPHYHIKKHFIISSFYSTEQ